MPKHRRIGILSAVIAFGVILSGCGGKPEIVVDPTLNEENAGEIFVYRPWNQWMGLAIDFRVTLDGQYIGSLKTGGYVQGFAAPGDHVIEVQPHFLSIPDGKPGVVTVATEAGERYYIRFSQHLDSIIMAGTSAIPLGHLELQLVPYAAWEQRR